MKKIDVSELCLSSVLLALLIAGSKISIPMGIINLTFQTLIVFIIISLVRKRCAILILTTYIILGLIGLPVFSTGGGYVYLLKPSFGFILGFLVAAIVVPNKLNHGWFKLINSTIALFVIYLFGCIYMYIILNFYMHMDKNVMYVIKAGVTPFILKDYICAILSTVISIRLSDIFYKKYEMKKVENYDVISSNSEQKLK